MKKNKLISILIIFIIIWNVTFPCISHATNNDEINSPNIEDSIPSNVELNNIENIKYAYEQFIVKVGGDKKEELLNQRKR